MREAALFTMEIEADLRDDFVAAAEATDRRPAQVMLELMRDFVRRQHEQDGYTAFIERKVAGAMQSVADGNGRSNDAVEADFAARRAEIAARM